MANKRLHIHSVPLILFAVGATTALMVAAASLQTSGSGLTAMFTSSLRITRATDSSGDISKLLPFVLSTAAAADTNTQIVPASPPEQVILPTDPGGAAAAVQAPRTMMLLQALDTAAKHKPTVR